jgi:hypothetical protein
MDDIIKNMIHLLAQKAIADAKMLNDLCERDNSSLRTFRVGDKVKDKSIYPPIDHGNNSG